MSLHMIQLPIRQGELMACGRQRGLVSDARSVDLGYLVHCLFSRALGELSPRPFDIQDQVAGETRAPGQLLPTRPLAVLAYSASDIGTLRDHAQQCDDAPALAAISWDSARSKEVPGFKIGQRLGFHVRVCPVIRIGRCHPLFRPGAEVDPYLSLIRRGMAERMAEHPDESESELKAEVQAALPSREAVYQEWLRDRIGGAADLDDISMVSMRDASLWRRGKPGEGAGQMYGRPRARLGDRSAIGRREAMFEGTLQVRNADLFRDLLARGVGRHRSFGFGMILLTPPRD